MSITRIGTYSQIKGSGFKLPCKVATTENITLSGEQTIDGVNIVTGDRVLVYNQSTGSTNGIYVASGSTWSRSIDMSLNDDVFCGLEVYVNSGTANGGKTFVLSTSDPITLNTTSLTFAVISSGDSGSSAVEAQNTGHTITTTDQGKTFTCDSSTGVTRMFYLPSVGTTEIGYEYTIVKLGSDQVSVIAADNDKIEDSGEGMSIYCADDGIATITLKLVTSTQWIMKFANGTWITTV